MSQKEKERVIEIYGPNYKKTDIPTFIRNRTEARLAKIRAEETLVEEHEQEEIEIWDADRGWLTIKKPVL